MSKKCDYEGPENSICRKKAIYECPFYGSAMCEKHTKEMSGEFPPYYCSNFDCKPKLIKIRNKKVK
jgi:hypothetical protein